MDTIKITETGDATDDKLMQDVVDAVMAVMAAHGLEVADPIIPNIPVRNRLYPEKPDGTEKLEAVVQFVPLAACCGPVLRLYHDFSFSSAGNLNIFLDCQ